MDPSRKNGNADNNSTEKEQTGSGVNDINEQVRQLVQDEVKRSLLNYGFNSGSSASKTPIITQDSAEEPTKKSVQVDKEIVASTSEAQVNYAKNSSIAEPRTPPKHWYYIGNA